MVRRSRSYFTGDLLYEEKSLGSSDLFSDDAQQRSDDAGGRTRVERRAIGVSRWRESHPGRSTSCRHWHDYQVNHDREQIALYYISSLYICFT